MIEQRPGQMILDGAVAPEPMNASLMAEARHFKGLRRMVGYVKGEFRPGSYSTEFTHEQLLKMAGVMSTIYLMRARVDDPEELLADTNRIIAGTRPSLVA